MTRKNIFTTITHFGHQKVTFEPVSNVDGDDELAKAVNAPIYHDNHWDLRDDVNAKELEKFWDDATQDLETSAAPEK